MDLIQRDVVDDVLALYTAHGRPAYHGEAITQTEHALQAAWLAEQAGARAELIAAALLHDIGHLLHDEGEGAAARGVDTRHEARGAAFLARHFVTGVVAAVSLHVEAKRYLAAASGYVATLSPASVLSLRLQGGPMSETEIRAFEAKRAAADAVALRRWDDAAKVVGLVTPGLDHFRPCLEAASR